MSRALALAVSTYHSLSALLSGSSSAISIDGDDVDAGEDLQLSMQPPVKMELDEGDDRTDVADTQRSLPWEETTGGSTANQDPVGDSALFTENGGGHGGTTAPLTTSSAVASGSMVNSMLSSSAPLSVNTAGTPAVSTTNAGTSMKLMVSPSRPASSSGSASAVSGGGSTASLDGAGALRAADNVPTSERAATREKRGFAGDEIKCARFKEFIAGFLSVSVFHAADVWLPLETNAGRAAEMMPPRLFLFTSDVQVRGCYARGDNLDRREVS